MRFFGRRPFRSRSCRLRFYLTSERLTESAPPNDPSKTVGIEQAQPRIQYRKIEIRLPNL